MSGDLTWLCLYIWSSGTFTYRKEWRRREKHGANTDGDERELLKCDAVNVWEVRDFAENDSTDARCDGDASYQSSSVVLWHQVFHVLNLK